MSLVDKQIENYVQEALGKGNYVLEKSFIVSKKTEDKYFLFTPTMDKKSWSVSANTNIQMPVVTVMPYSYKNTNVTQIAANGFFNRKTIETVVIQENISIIGKNAFAQCSNLKTVYINSNNIPQIGSNIFYGTSSELVILVPKGMAEKYKEDAMWSKYSDIIKETDTQQQLPTTSDNNGIVNVIVPTIVDSNDVSMIYNFYFINNGNTNEE